MRNGYFSNNKLALWLHVRVRYTAKAFNTAEGVKALNDLARKNGRDLDGTPIIATVSDIDNLASKGFIAKTTRPATDPLRYSICPAVKDPREGGIARDQFLAYTRKPDGSPLEPAFLANFLSLQSTGGPSSRFNLPNTSPASPVCAGCKITPHDAAFLNGANLGFRVIECV